MNRNLILFILSFCILPCIFFSCEKEDRENESPVIKIFSLKEGDVVYTDSSYTLTVEFTDNEALSSYSVQIYHKDYTPENPELIVRGEELNDSITTLAYFNRAFQELKIFNYKYYRGPIFNAFRVDSIFTVNSQRRNIVLGEHYFRLTLIDVDGNVTKDSFLIDVVKYVKP